MLAEQQAALMAALAGDAPVPQGFDAARVRAAAQALAFKRARAVAQAWPSVRAALGETFRDRFAEYSVRVPIPREGGPLADGRAFVRDLAARRPLPDAVRLQALAVDTRYRRAASGLVPRRLPLPRFAWLPQSRRLAIAFGARSYCLALAPLRR